MLHSLHNLYTGAPILPNVLKSPNLTYAISRFLAKIIPVPISPNFFEIYISNYFVCVMNDVTSRIEFRKSTLINFYLIEFDEVLNSTHFGDSRHSNLS
jgi:hypothetical protein